MIQSFFAIPGNLRFTLPELALRHPFLNLFRQIRARKRAGNSPACGTVIELSCVPENGLS
jgi:hypothetical protein